MFTQLIKRLAGAADEQSDARGDARALPVCVPVATVRHAELIQDALKPRRGRIRVEQPSSNEWREAVILAPSVSQLWMEATDPALLLWILHMAGERREMVWRSFAHWSAAQVIPFLPRDAQREARGLIDAAMSYFNGMCSHHHVETAAQIFSENLNRHERPTWEERHVGEVNQDGRELGVAAAISAMSAPQFDDPSNAACEALLLAREAIRLLKPPHWLEEFNRRAATDLRALAGNPFLLLKEEEAQEFLTLLRISLDGEASQWAGKKPGMFALSDE